MAEKNVINAQDNYLNNFRKEAVPLTIHLINGYQFKGIIKAFDNFTILLKTTDKHVLIYKHAVSTISYDGN
ncbi:MAG: RNA chaperone Hfq [Clostridia bacterium]|nr:RNA chaperone Hfq [Clostridia bacterium]